MPIQIKRRSGRKLVTLPNGETAPARPWDTAPTPLQLAPARGHRWLALLTSGEAKSLREIACRAGVDSSYVSRMVNLTTLAPDIVAAILDDALPSHITLFELAVDPPVLWEEQRKRFSGGSDDRVPLSGATREPAQRTSVGAVGRSEERGGATGPSVSLFGAGQVRFAADGLVQPKPSQNQPNQTKSD